MKPKNLRELKPDFLRLYNEEKKYIREIARIYDVDKSSVSRYIHEDTKPRVRGLTDEQKETAKRMYESFYTVSEITKELEAVNSTVRNFLIREYGEIRSSRNSKKYEHLRDSFVEDYNNGLSSWDISKKYNVSPTTILNYIGEKGVKARDYSESSNRYEIYEEYFDVLDNHRAYILGLIVGNSSENKKSSMNFIDLRVSENQKNMLDEILETLYVSECPALSVINKTLVVRIQSKKLVKRILELKNQMFSTEIPKELENFKGYFLKGVIRSSKVEIEKGICLKLYESQIEPTKALISDFFKLEETCKSAKDVFASNENFKVLGLTFCKEHSIYRVTKEKNQGFQKELSSDIGTDLMNNIYMIFLSRDQEYNMVQK